MPFFRIDKLIGLPLLYCNLLYIPGLCRRKEISSGYSVAECGAFVLLDIETFALKGDLKFETLKFWFKDDVKFVFG